MLKPPIHFVKNLKNNFQLSAHELLPDLEESQSEENQLTVGSGSSIIVNKRVKSIEHVNYLDNLNI